MSYVEGADRRQTQLLPASVEEYVSAEAAVRAIDAFVEGLDLAALQLREAPAATGRPGYDPADLLKLYIYGYLHRLRSSRRLEAETHRNLELIWLLRGLRPDHWTISEFRRKHRSRFKGVLREFNLLCRKLELFGAELVAIDGAKFKAVNSPRRHYTREELRELIGHIDTRIEAYLTELDQADQEGAGRPADALRSKLTQLQDRRFRHAALADALEALGESAAALTDPDSGGQKQVGVGYNVQVAVDARHDLIAAEEVTAAANDLGQLHALASAAQGAIGVTHCVADAGYHEGVQLEKCEQAGLVTYVPAPRTRAGETNTGVEVYPKSDFHYDGTRDGYQCPAGQFLPKSGGGSTRGKVRHYYSNRAACGQCPCRPQCTTAAYRRLSRLENEPVVERQAERVAAHPQIVRERKTIVEHVFGTLREWGHDVFLCRGLAMVRAEFTLSALAYNLRRALNVIGVPRLLAALRPAS